MVLITFDMYGHNYKNYLDTGADVTSLFHEENWDYEKKEYIVTSDKFSLLNDSICYKRLDNTTIANGNLIKIVLIGFAPNVRLRIGELPFVTNEVFSFSDPL
jgi:hypothetical protein